MKFARLFPLLFLLGAGGLFAQTASEEANPAAKDSSIAHHEFAIVAGIVTKEPGSEPVKKALIELIAESQNEAGNYTAISGPDGSFRIENVMPGRYRLFVERTGYQEVDRRHHRVEGRSIALIAGQELKDLFIRLQASAIVEGRVTDEDGDPLPEAQVAVLRQTFVSGRSRWEQVSAERTNDLGEYRIAGLAAGAYFISVTPPPDFRSLIEAGGNATAASHAASPADKPAPLAYQTTYYPGTKDRRQAASIQLHAGDDFPANFSLTPSPSLTIRGSVVGLPGGATAAIMLQSKDFSLILNGAEMHKDGSFEIRDVSPGAYTIVATVDNAPVPMMARQSIQVTANIDGVRLAPQTGATIRGRVRIEAANGKQNNLDLTQMFLLLRSADGDADGPGSSVAESSSTLAHVHADGTFEWKDVPAGRYVVQISDSSSMADWFVKFVSVGARNAADSGFDVNGGSIPLDVIISENGAVAEGFATNSKDEPVADAVIVAIPDQRLSHSDRYRKAVTDQRGHFTLRALPPGDYALFAWESLDGDPYYDPEFVKTYEGKGKAVHVNEGDRLTEQLKAIPVQDDAPEN